MEVLIVRYDYMIGIYKFSGPSSFPRDQGIFRGLFWDIVLLIFVVTYQRFADYQGADFVVTTDDIRTDPAFSIERNKQYAQSSGLLDQSIAFFLKLLPNYYA
jgi:hypothetical protein